MTAKTKIRNILILALVTIGGLYAVSTIWQTRQQIMISHLQTVLSDHGFKDAQIHDLNYRDNWLAFTGISLDSDKFSTIDAISVQTGIKDLLLGLSKDHIVIDGVKLTGEYDSKNGLDIAGWTKTMFPIPQYDDLLLNGATLDVMTSEGALRFQAKGIGKRGNTGVLTIKGMLWALQNQLKFETNWDANIYPDNTWEAATEISNAGINLEKIKASRMNGWLTFDKTKTAIPVISGQIDAGMFSIGDLNFSEFRLTLSGPYTEYKLIATGKVSGYENVLATLDVTNKSTGPYVSASIETTTLTEMIDFLQDLQNSDTEAGTFTKLLLTEGNLNRLAKDIEAMSFDALELEISGPLYDLAGKITAKTFKDGVTERHVISLDPGDQADKG